MRRDAQVVRKTLAAGARGYLTADRNPKALIRGIYKAAAGTRAIDPCFTDHIVFDGMPDMDKMPHDRLSGRECGILRLLVDGASSNEIARDLAISDKTVSTRKTRIMKKLNCKNTTQLFRYAILHEITELIWVVR